MKKKIASIALLFLIGASFLAAISLLETTGPHTTRSGEIVDYWTDLLGGVVVVHLGVGEHTFTLDYDHETYIPGSFEYRTSSLLFRVLRKTRDMPGGVSIYKLPGGDEVFNLQIQ